MLMKRRPYFILAQNKESGRLRLKRLKKRFDKLVKMLARETGEVGIPKETLLLLGELKFLHQLRARTSWSIRLFTQIADDC